MNENKISGITRIKKEKKSGSICQFDRYVPYTPIHEEKYGLGTDVTKGVTLLHDGRFDDVRSCVNRKGFKAMPRFIFFASCDKDQDALMEECRTIAETIENKIFGNDDDVGVVTGYAAGTNCGYIDLVIFDKDLFLDAAEDVLSRFSHAFLLTDSELPEHPVYLCTGKDTDVVRELDSLRRMDAFDAMLSVIEDLDPAEAGRYDIAVRGAAALNGLGEFNTSLDLLYSLIDKGKNDIFWISLSETALEFEKRLKDACELFVKCGVLCGDE